MKDLFMAMVKPEQAMMRVYMQCCALSTYNEHVHKVCPVRRNL
jgi:hypothetical protein